MGKIFDNRSVDRKLDQRSWSQPYIKVEVNHSIHGNSITGFQSPENKKILTHTVVGRKELIEEISKQETKLNELSYFTSPEAASEYLQKLNTNLKSVEGILAHSVMDREDLKKKFENG